MALEIIIVTIKKYIIEILESKNYSNIEVDEIIEDNLLRAPDGRILSYAELKSIYGDRMSDSAFPVIQKPIKKREIDAEKIRKIIQENFTLLEVGEEYYILDPTDSKKLPYKLVVFAEIFFGTIGLFVGTYIVLALISWLIKPFIVKEDK